MDRSSYSRFQLGLIAFLLVVALGMALIIFLLLRERNAGRATSADSALASAEANPARGGARPSPITLADGDAPALTPTFVPVVPAASAAPVPTATAVAQQALQPATPAPAQPVQPTEPPVAAPPATPIPEPAVLTPVRLDDASWQGGYTSTRSYGGRSARWVYGTNTQYSSMQTAFNLAAQPGGTATLTIEGMDSEDRAKTPIQITVNGVEIFNGPNPLPNDDQPLETGTWASATFRFNAALLNPGQNILQISNLKSGEFSLPPFFMLDYAVLSFS